MLLDVLLDVLVEDVEDRDLVDSAGVSSSKSTSSSEESRLCPVTCTCAGALLGDKSEAFVSKL